MRKKHGTGLTMGSNRPSCKGQSSKSFFKRSGLSNDSKDLGRGKWDVFHSGRKQTTRLLSQAPLCSLKAQKPIFWENFLQRKGGSMSHWIRVRQEDAAARASLALLALWVLELELFSSSERVAAEHNGFLHAPATVHSYGQGRGAGQR